MDLRSLGASQLGAPGMGGRAAHLGAPGLGAPGLLGGNMAARERGAADLQSFEEALRSAAARGAPAEAPPASDRAASEPRAAAPELSRASPLASLPGVRIDRDSELFRQCLELETFLVKTLISSMRGTIQRSGLIEQSFAGEMYEDMLFDKRARVIAESAGFGLAEMAYLELTGQRGRVVLR